MYVPVKVCSLTSQRRRAHVQSPQFRAGSALFDIAISSSHRAEVGVRSDVAPKTNFRPVNKQNSITGAVSATNRDRASPYTVY